MLISECEECSLDLFWDSINRCWRHRDTLHEHCPPDLVTGMSKRAKPKDARQATGGSKLRSFGKAIKELKGWISHSFTGLL